MDAGNVIFRRPLFAKGKSKETIGLDKRLLLYLWAIASGPTVASIIDFVSMWATTSTFTVEVRSKLARSTTPFTDEILNETFGQQCNRKLELMVSHALIFGWVAVTYTTKDGLKNDQLTGGDTIINVLHPYEYEPRYKITKRGNKKWLAFTRLTAVGDTNTVIPRSRVFVWREPEPVTYKPTSPLMFALRSVFQYDEVFALQQIVANKLAMPVHFYESDLTKIVLPNENPWDLGEPGTVARGGMATDPSGAPEDVGLAPVSQAFLKEWNYRQALQRMSSALHDQATRGNDLAMQMFKLPSRTKDTVEEFVEKSIQNPTLPYQLLTPGTGLAANVPEPKTIENFDTIEEVLKIQICTLLGVPVEFIFGGGKFASDIALNRRIMETRTTRLHKWLGEVLSEIFLDIHFADIYKKVEAYSEDLAFEEALELVGKVDRETFLLNGIMLKNKYKVLLEQDLLISVQFAETTSASEDSLMRALETGVIGLEKYQQLMLATMGIPQSAKAKLSANKIKQLEKHIRGLDVPPKGAGAAAGLKPKPKATKTRPAKDTTQKAKKQKTSETELRSQEKKQKAQAK
jgi:hypothetical protein